MRETLRRLVNFVRRMAGGSDKSMPSALMGGQWTGTGFVDAYKRNRNPTPNELLAELKGTAWSCVSINAAVCANFPPHLYVSTARGQARPKCLTKALSPEVERRLRAAPHLARHTKAADAIEEVVEHPLLTLLRQVNPVHNAFDLWELTQTYLEVHGRAFWYLSLNPALGVPDEIWILPSQNVTPRRKPDSRNLIDYYEYRTGASDQRFRPDEVIFFRYPDPRDPYTGGLSPLRACYEQVALLSDYAAMKKAVYENQAIPSALLTPEEVIGEEERDRLETQWNQRFRKGGAGRVVVAESNMKLQILSHSLGDLAQLAEMGTTKDDVMNAFHIPVSYFTRETNLANLQAADHQHKSLAIAPRLTRRDEKLNEQLLPLYDPTGRLFLASEDPVPLNQEMGFREREIDMKYGIVTINEVRGERGLPPVPWGDVPWIPATLWPTTAPRGEGTGAAGGDER
ncbi:MAG TPA: phage portal protein [Gemmataceae bacterium]|nr:phage portal protein [Gemmataceae bacterium]